MLRDEYEMLRDLQHENIIKIYALINFENFLMMSMKLTKENLAEFSSRRLESGAPLSEEECAQIMKGVFRGVAYLHTEKDIIHRDLKPPNIVVGSYSDLSQVRIIDFGIATHNRKQDLRKYGNVGTLVFQPPEQVLHKFHYGKVGFCGLMLRRWLIFGHAESSRTCFWWESTLSSRGTTQRRRSKSRF